MHKCVIIGGGTFSFVAHHLSLAAPAFGQTAKVLAKMFEQTCLTPVLKLTKMADSTSEIITNQDLALYVSSVLTDKDVKVIILNAALCDFQMGNPTNERRLSSKKNYHTVLAGVTSKVISEIKLVRPDIIVVGFKTTAGADHIEQHAAAKRLMEAGQLDIVLANDLETRINVLLTPTWYAGGPREFLLEQIVDECIKLYKEGECFRYC